MASHQNLNYLLGHVPAMDENPRLDTQHERITHGIMGGRLVHESIPLDCLEGPVADICCGTGVWLKQLSDHFARPERHGLSIPEFVGFDSNPSAFSDTTMLASKVRLVEHDCTQPFDRQFTGMFELVNLRGLALTMPKRQLSILFRNAISLLKPGGFLQWLNTEPKLWKSIPESKYFAGALKFVSEERNERQLVSYMPDFMINEYLSTGVLSSTSPSNPTITENQLQLKYFSLLPGGAARPNKSCEGYLNSCFSDTVLETLQLISQGIVLRTQERSSERKTITNYKIPETEKLIDFIIDARKSRNITVCGNFPLLIVYKSAQIV